MYELNIVNLETKWVISQNYIEKMFRGYPLSLLVRNFGYQYSKREMCFLCVFRAT